MSDFTLSIAGVSVCLRGEKKSIARARRRYAAFRTHDRPELVIDWKEATPPKSNHYPDPLVLRSRRGMTFSRRDLHGSIEGRKGEAITKPHPSSFDSYLRLLWTELLADRGGILVHAAGIGNWLFPGNSNAGKTTLVSLTPKKIVLSDELIAVLQTPKGVMIYGTPFWGRFSRGTYTKSHPLEAIYFLRRRRAEAIRPLSPIDASVQFLKCVLCYKRDRARSRHLLRAVTRIVTSVPCFQLSYQVKNETFQTLSKKLKHALAVEKGLNTYRRAK